MVLLNLSDLLRRENPGSQVAMLRYVPALRRSSQGHGAIALGGDATLRGGERRIRKWALMISSLKNIRVAFKKIWRSSRL